ncbi:hypothetical protein APHAL10511_003301 [Amanita phalloides]|nr:hypothetical protein APHAL10511_003301 [Amanita phalloides]
MPNVASGSKILVTGANGFIATYAIRDLLEQGYTVRGTVRSEARGAFVRNEFRSYGDRFELAIVEDVIKEGAFDEAIKDVDAILHLAAPVLKKYKHPKEVIDPAVNGTLGILRSAQAVSSVKRVILMGSCVSVTSPSPSPNKVWNENNWNEWCLEEYEKNGVNTPEDVVYQVEKVLSERAAWSFYNENKHQLSWDMAVILPPFVFGPYIGEAKNPSEMNYTAKVFYDYIVDFNSLGQPNEALASHAFIWVHVRDISLSLVKSLSVAEVAGERMIVSAGGFTWQDWIDVANSLSPSPIPSHAPGTAKALPRGNPGAGKAVQRGILEVTKEQKIFGLKYRSMEECARDMLADIERRGF